MAPDIGPVSMKTVVIDKSDNAEGVVEFLTQPVVGSSSVTEKCIHNSIILPHNPEPQLKTRISGVEEDGVVSVPVRRGPGTFGDVEVVFSSADLTALSGRDYLPPSGVLTLPDGVGLGHINVTLIDDSEREFREQFQLTLVSVSGEFYHGTRRRYSRLSLTFV